MNVLSKPFRLALIASLLCLFFLLPAILDRPTYEPALSVDHWLPGDDFFQWHAPPHADFPASILHSHEPRFWYNYSPGTGSTIGRLETKPFVLEQAELIIPTFGFPNAKGAGAYVESMADGRRFPVNPGATHQEWQASEHKLPDSFVHTPVRLVAYSDDHTAIGVGTPYYRVSRALPGLAFSQLFGAGLFSIGYLLLLLLPAFQVVDRLFKASLAETWLTAFVLAALGTLALFFCCHYWPVTARALARVWLVAGLLVAAWRLRPGTIWAWRPGYSCLLVALGLTLFQACFVFAFRTSSPLYTANYLFYPASWSTDNQIPVYVTQYMADGIPLTELPIAPWKISDRTPLLSCLLFPAATLLRHFPHQITFGAGRVLLQMCGFAFQNLWALPVWLVLRRLRLGQKERLVALLLLAATPFLFYNTIYIWPKLLAAIFCLIQYLYLADALVELGWSRRRLGLLALSGAAAGLALMSHGAAALAVVGIYLVAFLQVPWRQWGCVPVSGVCSALVIAPWIFWTRAVAPTENPLPRFLLTADFGFALQAPSGILESTIRMYRTMPFSAWLRAKWVALQTLAGSDTSIAQMSLAPFREPFAGFESIRAYQFFFLLPSLGLLLVPLVWLLLAPRREKENPAARLVRGLAWAAGATLLLQFLIMMAPHLLHHYPYFLPLALHLLAVVAITTRPSKILRLIACANYLLFVFAWIGLILFRTPVRSPGAIILSLLLLAAATVTIGSWAVRPSLQSESR
ncbi:MAG: hypothetical protein QOH88_855 [Verrucomicrobiota bacterium]|jgi:hypothetical protein